jgi:DNA polymerase-3 subunit beta
VSYAARAVPSRPAQPIHAGLLLEADGSELRVSGYSPTDRVSASTAMGATVTTPGRVLLPGRLLAEIAAALPAGEVSLDIDDSRASVTAGTAQFGLPLLPVRDYPALPTVSGRIGVVPAADLADAVGKVAFAAQADATVPALAGIHLEVAGKTLTFAATDRYRLAVGEVAWTADDKKAATELTLPAKAFADAVKGFARDGEVTIGVSGRDTLSLTSATRSVTIGALDCDYPRWQSLVPASSTTTAVLDARQVADALARVSLVKDRAAPVRVTFDDGEVRLLVAGEGDGREASGSDRVECVLRGKGLTMGVNPQLLREGLLACATEKVQIELTGPSKPALVTPVGKSGYRYLVMPVRLSS